ncbi:MAG: hypothetical protein CM15mP129_01280 [Chloroflexota bacterium]|nr:MAG: hypothetical protein CM15mP129_01280 [Chloroflexota bacterium]
MNGSFNSKTNHLHINLSAIIDKELEKKIQIMMLKNIKIFL